MKYLAGTLSSLLFLCEISACTPNVIIEAPPKPPRVTPSPSDRTTLIIIPDGQSNPVTTPTPSVQPVVQISSKPTPIATLRPKATPVPKPTNSVQAIIQPVVQPSSKPSAKPLALLQPVFQPSSQPTSQASSQATGTATPVPTPSATLPPLVITGESNFTQVFPFKIGMKWVYKNSLSVPGFDSQQLPPTTLTSLEVIGLDANQVTIKSQPVNEPGSSFTTLTVANDNLALVHFFVLPQNIQVGGTVNWSAPVTNSLSLESSNYNAELYTANMSLYLPDNGGVPSNRDVKLWLNQEVGMVKEEIVSPLIGSPFIITYQIEIQSFEAPAPGS